MAAEIFALAARAKMEERRPLGASTAYAEALLVLVSCNPTEAVAVLLGHRQGLQHLARSGVCLSGRHQISEKLVHGRAVPEKHGEVVVAPGRARVDVLDLCCTS